MITLTVITISGLYCINIAVAELRKIQTLDGQKEMVHYGLSTFKKKKKKKKYYACSSKSDLRTITSLA
jgi:hypothetical protein